MRRRAGGPRVLVAAGLDPTGGAGLAADVEALLAVGARALPVATAITVQGPAGALRYDAVPARLVVAQVQGLFTGGGAGADAAVSAVKTGMLGSGANAAALGKLVASGPLAGLPLVVDPVLAASSGLPLLEDARGRPPARVLAALLANATLATPNWPELAALGGCELADLRSDDDAVEVARRIPCPAVLVKGGHRPGAPVDLLVRHREVRRFAGRRRPGTARGTGCRLASALAGLLGRGAKLEEAVRGAKEVVERYLDAEAGR